MNKIFFYFLLIVTSLFASDIYKDSGQILSTVYGLQTAGCTQVSVTQTGHNRSGPYTAGKRYLVYGYDGAANAYGTGVALRCVWGDSSVDVTSLAGSKVGEVIFANQQRVYAVTAGSLYISCISESASKKFDVCGIQ